MPPGILGKCRSNKHKASLTKKWFNWFPLWEWRSGAHFWVLHQPVKNVGVKTHFFSILEKMTQCLSADFCYRAALNLSFGSVLDDLAFCSVLDVAETCFSLPFWSNLLFCSISQTEKGQTCFCILLRRLHQLAFRAVTGLQGPKKIIQKMSKIHWEVGFFLSERH